MLCVYSLNLVQETQLTHLHLQNQHKKVAFN